MGFLIYNINYYNINSQRAVVVSTITSIYFYHANLQGREDLFVRFKKLIHQLLGKRHKIRDSDRLFISKLRRVEIFL
jgi:hypothetical protein